MGRGTSSFRRAVLVGMFSLAFVSMGLWGAIWISEEYEDFSNESQALREKYLAAQQDLLRNQVTNVVDYIRYMAEQTDSRIKSSVRQRVEEACAVAQNIYLENRDLRTPSEIQKMIKDSLRPIRFNKGRGYFFAFDLNGIEKLFADRPEMEGRNMLAVRGAKGEPVVRDMLDLVRARGEGFYEYTWTKPHVQEKDFPKIAYVKLFEPYGWVIGTGEYLDDVTNEIQDEVLDRIVGIRFDPEGYFFGSTFRGEPLFSSGKITRGTENLWDLADPDGVKVIQEQRKAAELPGGGFVHYSWPKLESSAPVSKLAYVLAVPQWQWIIGAGVYLDTIDLEIARKREILKDHMVTKIERSLLILLPILLLVLLWVRYLSNRVQSGFKTFSSFFEQAATRSITINAGELHFLEFQRLAQLANRMISDRKQAEAALKASEERLHLALDSAEAGVWDRDIVADKSVWDDRVHALFGLAPGTFSGNLEHFLSLLHPDDRERVRGEMATAIHEGVDFTTAYRVIWPDSSVHFIADRGKVYLDPEGRPVRMTGVNWDFTELHRAQEALQESEERLRLSLEATNDGIWDWNILTGEAVFSPRWYTMLGYEPCEFPRNYPSWRSLVHPDDIDESEREIQEHIASGEGYAIELRMRTKDGGWLWILTRGRAVEWDSDGHPVRMVGTHVDITQRKKSEELLQESESRFRTLAENMPVGVSLMREDLTYEYFNPEFTRIFGYAPEEIPDRNALFERFYPDVVYRQQILTQREAPGRDGPDCGGVDEDTVTVRAKAGKEKKIHIRSVVLEDRRCLVTYQDVTEHRKLEEQLRHAQKMEAIGALAGGIAHDFNNILGIIMGYAELTDLKISENSDARRSNAVVLKAAQRAKNLVRQILAFSRKGELERTPLQITAAIKETLHLLRAILPSTVKIQHEFSLSPGEDLVWAVPIQIHQILMNLATNAGHAMGEKGGTLRVTVSSEYFGPVETGRPVDLSPGEYVKITVEDTGHGMDRGTLQRIFDPYFTTKGPGDGTGMGLSVAHGIVKEHQGAITVESRPGEGSSFQVYLPRLQGGASPEAEALAPVPGGTERILLVDDEEQLVEAVRERLEHLGYEVRATTSSPEALEIFSRERDRFDLVITDYTMPVMTGLDLAAKMRDLRSDIPVILCTGFSEWLDEDAAKARGISSLAMKPLSLRGLGELIRKVLAKG